MTSTQRADAYALVYGNMVNSERTANFISHVSSEDEVEFSEDPSEIRIHGEHLKPVSLSGYRRDFSHEMTDELLSGEWADEYDSIDEMLRAQYPGTENNGALNIEADAGGELNAVLVPMTDDELDFYEQAELGYYLESIDKDNLDESVERPVFAAVSQNTGDADPIHGYVEDCIDSWSDWGESDKERFLNTTHVDGESLYDWASERQMI